MRILSDLDGALALRDPDRRRLVEALREQPDSAFGLGRRRRRLATVSLDGRVELADRQGIERLARYCACPAFALERFHAPDGQPSLQSPNARLVYRLPGPEREVENPSDRPRKT